MFKNYLKIAYRNIKKHKGYSLINVAGLAIGMACCILILLFVFDELSYDKFHENHDRIYRVTRKWLNEDGVVNLHLGHVAPSIGPLLENDFPEILHAVRMIRIERLLVGNNFATYLLMSENHDINRLKSQLQPLTDIHLHSHLDSEIEANSDIMYVYVFSIIAFFVLLIAWPVAYLVMSPWLQNFAYRSGIVLGTFLLAGGLAWVIAFLTVSYQVIKTSLADPVKALKYE